MKITDILPDKNQPRKYFGIEKMASLKDSIKKHGIISPLIVQRQGDKYLLIDGERRYRTAVELNLKEVPVQIVQPKNDFLRLVEQFHIQEQHESWSATEKAIAILDIAEIAKKPLKEICELLSIDQRSFRYYQAFALLQNKEKFVSQNISLNNAEKIGEIKRFAKKIKEEVLNEPFTKANESKLEKSIIEKIKNREIMQRSDYSRIKDSFRSNPKLIDVFINQEFDINKQFVESNARAAYYARNVIANATYTIGNANGFLKDPNVTLTEGDMRILKKCVEVCQKIINLVE